MTSLFNKSSLKTLTIAGLLLLGFLSAGEAAYMLTKAQLAQHLIKRSWNTTGRAPWPWADTRPVARLLIPDIKLDSYVLNGATGAILAFGPGMVSGSAIPGGNGITMIAAHRDTHFESLKTLSTGAIIQIQNTDKEWHQYRVTGTRVADARVDSIDPNPLESRMILVTCYPFDALIPGGPLRYVVEADLVSEPSHNLITTTRKQKPATELFLSMRSTQ